MNVCERDEPFTVTDDVDDKMLLEYSLELIVWLKVVC